MKRSKIECNDGCTTLNILEGTDLYTLDGQIVWCVNYISIKPLKTCLRIFLRIALFLGMDNLVFC